MDTTNPSRFGPSRFWFFLLGRSASHRGDHGGAPSGAANDDSVVATHSHGVLYLTIPYQAAHAGAGRLTVEVLDPDDQVLGREDMESKLPRARVVGSKR